MKLFNNIQEMWSYCEKCPTCSKLREVKILPYNGIINFYTKTKDYLFIDYLQYGKLGYLKINLSNNKIESNLDLNANFELRSECYSCRSWFESDTLYYNKEIDEIYNLGAYREAFTLNGKYLIFNYFENSLYINRDIKVKLSKTLSIYDKNLENKINTIITFS